MSLLNAPIVNNSHILARVCLIFLENCPDQTRRFFITKFGPHWKDWKSSYQVGKILSLSRNLIALILAWNCVKGLTVTKIVKKINFERVWGELRAKSCFQRQSRTGHLRQALVFMWNSALREGLNFHFQGILCYYWQNFHFGGGTGYWAIILWNLDIFLIFANALRS